MAKVLVVEDNLANQRLVRILLEAMQHQVECAFTGEEGWARVQDGAYDLVLLDMHLPGLDGFELAQRIKALKGGGVKVIAVTAMAMEGDRQKVLDSGCDGYFSKPISVPEFRERIAQILGGGDAPPHGEQGAGHE
jgi:two-component system cell cycle response regulator DivK